MVNGKEVWQLDGTTYKVRNYGVLMPIIVYNCAYMPAICKNIKKHLGSLPVADARREAVCPNSWIRDPGRCPESDQPDWTGYLSKASTKFGQYKALLQQTTDANGNTITSHNRLAEKTIVLDNVNGQPVQRTKWTALGAIMTCDEFSAARCLDRRQGGYGTRNEHILCTSQPSVCGRGPPAFRSGLAEGIAQSAPELVQKACKIQQQQYRFPCQQA
ncbi:hypothetical protein VTK56DRAFT_1260 [Thermocarpiscus australiensis]